MNEGRSRPDPLEDRRIQFAANIIEFSKELPGEMIGRHIAFQILLSGTVPAPNYEEARGAESRADIIHKLGIVQQELNEASVWLRILLREGREKEDKILAVLHENTELARIVTASLKTARAHSQVSSTGQMAIGDWAFIKFP
jgi:four helix bundle protein